jgi:hypothetical protein
LLLIGVGHNEDLDLLSWDVMVNIERSGELSDEGLIQQQDAYRYQPPIEILLTTSYTAIGE